MKRWLFVILAVFLVTSCAVPASVDPLPYHSIDDSGTRVETAELCRLYVKHGFVSNITGCTGGTATLVPISDNELSSNAVKARRNNLQHEILGVATAQCTEFKGRIQKRPRNHLMTAGVIALLLSAGATANTGQLATRLTSGATAFTSFGQLMGEAYPDGVPDILQGIEIARTRIFQQILGSQGEDLITYPLSRAVNDALRYHAVCNIAEGEAESSRATSEAALTGGEPSAPTAPAAPADPDPG
ncbi:hypothetical protein [Candidatus Rariloculus sp.]|uniref:hypothetical protein n=1 Tax=Candidatus Rariloculus sp. TaxID=3101265 RepID=UPI003D12609A